MTPELNKSHRLFFLGAPDRHVCFCSVTVLPFSFLLNLFFQNLKWIVLWIFILRITTSNGQNLVPNPDFESFTTCPTGFNGGWALECSPWFVPSAGTSDYFNACATAASGVEVPNTSFGFQQAHSGVAYTGIFVWYSNSNIREYLSVPLIEPLKPKTEYQISFYVSLSDIYCGSDRFGAYVSVSPLALSGPGVIEVTPQFNYSPVVISDNSNWTLITGCIYASGGEQYLTIGNFNSDSETTLDPVCAGIINQSYYFIDDVSLVENGPATTFDVELGDPVTNCSLYKITTNFPDADFYFWEDGSTDSTMTVTESGTYSVTIVDGCAYGTDSIEVTIIPDDVVDIGPLGVYICEGDTIDVSLDPSLGNYVWQDGSTVTEYSIATSGYYQVTLNGFCRTSTDQMQVVVVPPPPDDILGPDQVICMGEQIEFNFDPNVGTYEWQDGTISNQYLITSPGLYEVTVTNQCASVTDQINVLPGAAIEVDLGPDAIPLCQGNSLTLEAGIGGVTYTWNDGSNADTLNVFSPGVYSLTVNNACGSDTDSVLITDGGDVPIISLGSDTSFCFGNTLTLFPVSSGVQTWLWNDGSSLATYTIAGNETVTVMVSNACGSSFDTVHVSVMPPTPILDLGPDTSLCMGSTLALNINTPGVDVVWSDGSVEDQLLVNQSGEFYATISNYCGIRSDTVLVTINEQIPSTDLGPDTILCYGASLLLSADPISGVNFMWQDGSTGSSFTISEPGTYILTESNPCGVHIDSIHVDLVNGPAPFLLGNDTLLCEGATLKLDATTPGVTYQWQDHSEGSTFIVTAAGMYWASAYDGNCVTADTIIVSYRPLPFVDIGTDTIVCIGQTFILDATLQGASYTWQDNSIASTFLVSQAGSYHVIVNMDNCLATDTIKVDYIYPEVFELGPDQTICEGETLHLNPGINHDVEFLWQDNTTTNFYEVTHAGMYWLRITDACGSSADTISVTPDDCDCKIYVPNIFSPNGDNINDEMIPQSNCLMVQYQFDIFDRAGGLMFETNAWGEGWDGSINGIFAQVGVYAYVLRCTFENGEKLKLRGDITLIR